MENNSNVEREKKRIFTGGCARYDKNLNENIVYTQSQKENRLKHDVYIVTERKRRRSSEILRRVHCAPLTYRSQKQKKNQCHCECVFETACYFLRYGIEFGLLLWLYAQHRVNCCFKPPRKRCVSAYEIQVFIFYAFIHPAQGEIDKFNYSRWYDFDCVAQHFCLDYHLVSTTTAHTHTHIPKRPFAISCQNKCLHMLRTSLGKCNFHYRLASIMSFNFFFVPCYPRCFSIPLASHRTIKYKKRGIVLSTKTSERFRLNTKVPLKMIKKLLFFFSVAFFSLSFRLSYQFQAAWICFFVYIKWRSKSRLHSLKRGLRNFFLCGKFNEMYWVAFNESSRPIRSYCILNVFFFHRIHN